MNVQELIDENSFLRDELRRTRKENEEYLAIINEVSELLKNLIG